MAFLKSNTFPIFFLTFFALTIFCFCTKEDEKNQLAQQAKEIDQFVKSDTAAAFKKNRDTIITVTNKKETNRIVWNPCEGSDALTVGDTVTFACTGYLFRSGKGDVFVNGYSRNVVGAGYFLPGLDAGLLGMRAGEHAYIIFTSLYGYGNKELSTIPKMSPLMFEVHIESIVKKK
jgi:FKBP-type peptidyl-prolyl cis-trans isomerase